jgi:methyltransferase
MLIRCAICAYMAVARLIELTFSHANIASSGKTAEGTLSRRTYPLIVAVHAFVIGGTLLSGGRPRNCWLAALVMVQPLRYWVLLSLGRRWNARTTPSWSCSC